MEFQTSESLAKKGKKGNLICKFSLVWTEDEITLGDIDDAVYELRECPEDKNVYVVWWDWTEEEIKSMKEDYGCTLNDFQVYRKKEVEEQFKERFWKVLGNKCKRSIFKSN